jgi:hypothetical protein
MAGRILQKKNPTHLVGYIEIDCSTTSFLSSIPKCIPTQKGIEWTKTDETGKGENTNDS